MVLMLLSTVPLSGSPYSALSPCSPCSNPFSASFAAFLKPIFNEDDKSVESVIESAAKSSGVAPTFTHPWLKPSPLRTSSKKALPPLPPPEPADPPSPIRRESEPVLAGDRRRPQIAATFAPRGPVTNAAGARRSRYDSVPAVHIHNSPEEIHPSANFLSSHTHTHSHSHSQTTTHSTSHPRLRAPSLDDDEDHKLDISIAMSGVDLNISPFTPAGSSVGSGSAASTSTPSTTGTFFSDVFDAPPSSSSYRTPASSTDSAAHNTPAEVDGEDTMVVPLAIEVDDTRLPRHRMESLGATNSWAALQDKASDGSSNSGSGNCGSGSTNGNGRSIATSTNTTSSSSASSASASALGGFSPNITGKRWPGQARRASYHGRKTSVRTDTLGTLPKLVEA